MIDTAKIDHFELLGYLSSSLIETGTRLEDMVRSLEDIGGHRQKVVDSYGEAAILIKLLEQNLSIMPNEAKTIQERKLDKIKQALEIKEEPEENWDNLEF